MVLSATVLPTPPPAPILSLDTDVDVDFLVYKGWRCMWLGWKPSPWGIWRPSHWPPHEARWEANPEGTITGYYFAHQDHLKGYVDSDSPHLLAFDQGQVYSGSTLLDVQLDALVRTSGHAPLKKDASPRSKSLGQARALRALQNHIDRIDAPLPPTDLFHRLDRASGTYHCTGQGWKVDRNECPSGVTLVLPRPRPFAG